MLRRMRDLTVQSGNLGTNDRAALAANQNEPTQLQQEFDRINRDTRFGTQAVFTSFASATYDQFEPVVGTIAPSWLLNVGQEREIGFEVDGVVYTATLASNLTSYVDVVSALNAAASSDGTVLPGSSWSLTADDRLVFSDLSAPEVWGELVVENTTAFHLGLTGAIDQQALDTVGGLSVGAAVPVDFAALAGKTITFTVNGNVHSVTLDPPVDNLVGLVAALNGAVDGDGVRADVRGSWSDVDGVLQYNTWMEDNDDQFDSFAMDLDNTRRLGFGFGFSAFGTDAAAGAGQAVFQVGANAGQRVSVAIRPIDTQALELTGLDIGPDTSPERIDAALRAIDRAIGSVSANRAELGAFQNRMESTIRSLSVSVENLSAAESRIRDADMAMEMMEFTRSQILVQVGTAMLAQANLLPQMVLSLLRP